MQSDPDIEKDPAPRGRRRAHLARRRPGGRRRAAERPQDGPVFVDSSGRRARLLRRAGALVGLACAGYAAVLALAFMGGISVAPSQLLPFGAGPVAEAGPGGAPPGGGMPPGGTGAPPSGAPSPAPSASASLSAAGSGEVG
ncbi:MULTISPECIES: hypothetical protein [unclassified Streptomyces]|uniref:hypothetical protein n=1 Tax=unclassified Streptomyces TaxID=2593676 RepID=UPI0001C1A31E|nr:MULTISPECIES: hypothetical protein [unclassified Streptomyces]AEN13463.1 conserved hypothetical protein [Streptomyces sp. SirexAA-E]PZX34948.1 hypothetical protein K373_04934 [Streptomyces sp. DvalAA-21]RAJ40997.1 hypothetical protein K351_00448 [Streptomyces sp. DpondAA-E10]RAJ43927.1 hypothetical protein K352_04998 [Streptomyces sp. DpondAA-A50]SCE27641.1 hypothetical protein GA0115235_11622 [Streptomyces sp. DpondAA-F4a]